MPLSDEERGGYAMVTYEALFAFTAVIVAVVTLVIKLIEFVQNNKNNKK